MESECSRCHRKFQTSSETMTVCPDCLREEFAPAPAMGKGQEADAIKQVNELSLRRAAARAERLSDGFQTGAALTPYGMMRFALGVVIFLSCLFVFGIVSEMEEWQARMYLPEDSQRPLSILLCWVAAALVFSSTRQNKWFIYPFTLFFLVAGWFMPDFWAATVAKARKETAVAISGSRAENLHALDARQQASAPSSRERELTEEDLAIFREKRHAEGNVVNYGIYISTRDVGLRQSIRDTIARLLEAESCVAYTRGKGSLFIVSRAAGGTRNISRLAARFGDLNYANPSDGVYEVAFLPEKVHAVSHFPTEALSTPSHEAFVAANIAELRNLLDPHRVSTAAHALAAAKVQAQAKEVRGALIEVLRDPWASEPETYRALVEALVVYATPGDREAVAACRKFFLSSRAARRQPSLPVMELLIREVPGEMVSPVVELWCANPVEWQNMLSQLGTRPQAHLLDVLESTDSLQLIGSVLKHLENNGTPEAASVVKKFIDHPDSLISRTARNTLQALQGSAR